MKKILDHKKKLLTGTLILIATCFSVCRADDIAFFYALDADLRALKLAGTVTAKPVKIGDRSIQIITLGKHKVYAVKMGSGAVETAISGEALLGRFQCDRAFSLGPVGALSDKLTIGSWHEVSSIIAYQKGSWNDSGLRMNDATTTEKLTGVTLPAEFQKVTPIIVASGEIFVTSNTYREQLRQSTGADAVDMNLFGLVSVCASHHVSLTNWRVVSDKADDKAGEDFRKFSGTYNGVGGKAVAELIKNLPPNPNSPESYPELQKLLKGH